MYSPAPESSFCVVAFGLMQEVVLRCLSTHGTNNSEFGSLKADPTSLQNPISTQVNKKEAAAKRYRNCLLQISLLELLTDSYWFIMQIEQHRGFFVNTV